MSLIDRSTRGLFRDLMTKTRVGAIGAAVQDEGFPPNTDSAYEESVKDPLTEERRPRLPMARLPSQRQIRSAYQPITRQS